MTLNNIIYPSESTDIPSVRIPLTDAVKEADAAIAFNGIELLRSQQKDISVQEIFSTHSQNKLDFITSALNRIESLSSDIGEIKQIEKLVFLSNKAGVNIYFSAPAILNITARLKNALIPYDRTSKLVNSQLAALGIDLRDKQGCFRKLIPILLDVYKTTKSYDQMHQCSYLALIIGEQDYPYISRLFCLPEEEIHEALKDDSLPALSLTKWAVL